MLLCGGVYVGVHVYMCGVVSVCARVCSVVAGVTVSCTEEAGGQRGGNTGREDPRSPNSISAA